MKLYVARFWTTENNRLKYVGMCKQDTHEGKDVMTFQFLVENEIFEMVAVQKNATSNEYRCQMSMRQKGTEKWETFAEWEETVSCKPPINGIMYFIVSVEKSRVAIMVESNLDFAHFCEHPNGKEF